MMRNLIVNGLLLISACAVSVNALAETGVTKTEIVIGGVMDLEGVSQALGQGMREGISAALSNQKIKGRSIEFVTLNDSYNPTKTSQATEELINRGIFAMVGNVGTPTAGASLPLLANSGVPAVGFFTGAGLLRPGQGDIINYRASYVQETETVISAGLRAGVKPAEICAYVQNDGYGMAGIAGIRAALTGASGAGEIVEKLDDIMKLTGTNPARNRIGPVGVYKRNTFSSRNGYLSLKAWEASQGVNCRMVVTVGAYRSIASFIGYAASKGEKWTYSAVSFTGAENLRRALESYNVLTDVIVTQVVPPLKSNLPIVREAREALGEKLSYITLEGYIVGKLFLGALNSLPEKDITRSGFLTAIKGNVFDIGGVKLDFTSDNQGSDLVISTFLENRDFRVIDDDELAQLLQ